MNQPIEFEFLESRIKDLSPLDPPEELQAILAGMMAVVKDLRRRVENLEANYDGVSEP